MNADQLKAERTTRWRQNANPILTADDAQEWIASAGLCLLLPRRQFLAPAPSFVEACTGTPTELPTREAIENAMGLVHRLAEQNTVLPLNLFGTPTDQPDFLAAREVFPHIYSLIGTRDWKTVPSSKSSPLIIEIWKQLQEEGSLTAAELQTALGREVTEAAVLRGLIEMWSGLRVIPVYETGKATRWELIQQRFKDALTAAGKLSQTSALSALVSLYLESVLAASSDEIETFLSPLTSRSRVRETVNGLSATRQLDLVPVGSQAMLYISGSLPEFGEPEIESQPQEITLKPRAYDREPRTFDRERKPPTRKPFERKTGDGERGPRKFERPSRPGFKRAGDDRFAARPRPDTGSDRERPSDGAPRSRPAFRSGERPERGPQRSFGGGSKFPAKKFGTRSGPSKFGSGPARPGSGPKKFGARSDAGPSRPWQKRTEGGEERSFPRKEGFRPRRDDADERPRPPRREDGGERRSEGFGSRRKFGAPKKFGGAPKFGARPSFGAQSGDSRSSGPRPGGPKFGAPRSGAPRSGASGFGRKPGFDRKPEFGSKPGFDRKPGGERSRPDEGGKRPFFRKRPDQDASAESRPPRREGSWSKSGPKDRPSGSRPGFSGPRSAPRSDSAAGSGPRRTGSSWAAKKSTPGSGFKRTSSSKPGFGKSASGSRSGSGKPAFGKGGFEKRKSGGFADRKPGGFGKKPGGFAGKKPGGARPPFKKRKPEGGTSGE